MAVLKTESVTNWWPQTSSSKAFVVSSDPGCRTSAHRTAKGVGGSATATPSRNKRAFASSSSKRSKRTRTGFELAEDRAGSVRPGIFATEESLDRHATTIASNPLAWQGAPCSGTPVIGNLSTECRGWLCRRLGGTTPQLPRVDGVHEAANRRSPLGRVRTPRSSSRG